MTQEEAYRRAHADQTRAEHLAARRETHPFTFEGELLPEASEFYNYADELRIRKEGLDAMGLAFATRSFRARPYAHRYSITNALTGDTERWQKTDDDRWTETRADNARTDNPAVTTKTDITRANYPSVFGDFNRNGVPDVDDPDPYGPRASAAERETIEEVKLSDEVGKLIDDRRDYKEAAAEVADRLRAVGGPGAQIKWRVKTPYSIINKLRRKRLATLTDVAATMIVVEDQAAVDRVTRDILAGHMGKVLEHEDFYRTPNQGYRAQHFIVEHDGRLVEVQVKTERMSHLSRGSHEPYKHGVLDAHAMDRLAILAERADQRDPYAAREYDKKIAPLSEQELAQLLTMRNHPRRDNPLPMIEWSPDDAEWSAWRGAQHGQERKDNPPVGNIYMGRRFSPDERAGLAPAAHAAAAHAAAEHEAAPPTGRRSAFGDVEKDVRITTSKVHEHVHHIDIPESHFDRPLTRQYTTSRTNGHTHTVAVTRQTFERGGKLVTSLDPRGRGAHRHHVSIPAARRDNPESNRGRSGLGMGKHDVREAGGGRFAATPPCDACGKPTGADYMTDSEVCGDSDDPGFFICNRVRCGQKRDKLNVEERRALYTAVRAASRRG